MLKFNTILEQCGVDPKSVQMVRHQERGPDGMTPYALLSTNRADFEFYQTVQAREVFRRPFIASFVVSPNNETLFVDLYKIEEATSNSQSIKCPIKLKSYDAGRLFVYPIALDRRMQDFSLRLILDWGEGYRSWVQRPDKQNKDVLEIRRTFEEPAFPGTFMFRIKIDQIPNLYPKWKSILGSMKGVYLLICNETGAQYVGSASGENGFLGRWNSYAANGHGGNKILKEKARKDYTVSILETVGSKTQRKDILVFESLWKDKLGSRAVSLGDEFGLNAG